ncbi:MAG TPA: hypothetical protein PLJ27_15090, partial [Polyangiaceae bacterium]|nr:hypothetical protein [Polyangiaceae bacterium]
MKSCASARSSARLLDIAFVSLLTLATLGVLITVHLIFLRTPVEAQMGIVQKIFYFHVPSAYAMYLGATACFLGSTAYLFRI